MQSGTRIAIGLYNCTIIQMQLCPLGTEEVVHWFGVIDNSDSVIDQTICMCSQPKYVMG